MSEAQTDEEHYTHSVLQFMSEGGTLGQIKQFGERDQEAVYALGHGFYSQGRYSDALKAFSFLVVHNHHESRYLFSLASCCQMLRRYDEAIRYFTLVSLMDIADPVPTYHTAECLMGLGMVGEAIEMFGVVVADSGAQHAELKKRAATLIEMLGRKTASDFSNPSRNSHD